MTSYGYINMIIVDSCIIWFQLDCSMQLNNHTVLLLMFVAENVILLNVISLASQMSVRLLSGKWMGKKRDAITFYNILYREFSLINWWGWGWVGLKYKYIITICFGHKQLLIQPCLCSGADSWSVVELRIWIYKYMYKSYGEVITQACHKGGVVG